MFRPLKPLLALLATAFPAALPAQDRAAPPAGRRPNVIFIFSDDHAPHAISAYGSRINRTPNIDRLAQEGALFEHCFCGNSLCGPSRATILTGVHCHVHGFMRNGNRFDGSQTTFPKLLQKAGYQTAIIGKWHLTSDPTGFDYWRILPGQGQYYNPDFLSPKGKVRIQGYCTDITTDLALKWLDKGRDPNKPFMLMCQHKAPHRSWMPGPEELGLYRDQTIPEPPTLFDDYSGRGPGAAQQEMTIAKHLLTFYDLKVLPTAEEQKTLTGPDRWWRSMRRRMTAKQRAAWDAAFQPENVAFRKAAPMGRALVKWEYQRFIKNYLRCVAGVDKSVGQILAWLDAHPDLAANTVVVYSSDQGFYLGDHGWFDKRWMYEESLRMPLLVRWPGVVKPGLKIGELVQNIDFAPTFLDLAGVEPPAEMQGESLLPLLHGEKPETWRDAIYYHYYESHAVHNVPAHYGVRTERYKLIHFYEPEQDYWELYDLQKDPHELHSVAGDPEYADIRAHLMDRLRDLREKYGDRTGRIGDGAFQLSAGIAMAEPNERGWLVRGNTRRGYLLETCEPMSGQVRMKASVLPADPNHPGAAMLAVTCGDPRRSLYFAGVDYVNQKMIMVGPGGDLLSSVGVRLKPELPVQIELVIDLESHNLLCLVGNRSLATPLPIVWSAVTAYGYGLGTSTCEFSKIAVKH